MTKNTPTVKIIVATHKKYEMPQDAMYLPLHVGAEGKTDQNGNPLDLGYQKIIQEKTFQTKTLRIVSLQAYIGRGKILTRIIQDWHITDAILERKPRHHLKVFLRIMSCAQCWKNIKFLYLKKESII